MTGDVKYNGCRPNEFVIQNVAGGIGLLLASCFMRCDLRCLSVACPDAALVDEFDDHIANLSCRWVVSCPITTPQMPHKWQHVLLCHI